MSLTRRLSIIDSEGQKLLDTSLKIAFATTDMQRVNQHFGSAQCFAIYTVNQQQFQLLEVVEFGRLPQDGNEDKLTVKIRLLHDCAAVYCQAIGASAINQLISHGVQPVKVHEGSLIAELLQDLQQELTVGPSSWLAKALKKYQNPNPERFAAMDNETWEE